MSILSTLQTLKVSSINFFYYIIIFNILMDELVSCVKGHLSSKFYSALSKTSR